MKNSYSPGFIWIAICTFLYLTGARGDSYNANWWKNDTDEYSFKNVGTFLTSPGLDLLERNRRQLQEIYLLREKKDSLNPMNYLSKLYSDLEETSKIPLKTVMTASMVEGIIDPPQIELQFHRKVPNCESEFNITKIIRLVYEDKKQRKCPCSCLSKDKGIAAAASQLSSSMPATHVLLHETATGRLSSAPCHMQGALSEQQTPSQASLTTEQCFRTTTGESAVEHSGQQTVFASQPETPPKIEGPRPIETIKQKVDQSKTGASQKNREEKLRSRPVTRGPGGGGIRIGPPLSRLSSGDSGGKKVNILARPAGLSSMRQGNQMKNTIKQQTQMVANKPMHSKLTDFRQLIKAGPLDRGKFLNEKHADVSTGWDVAEPGVALPRPNHTGNRD